MTATAKIIVPTVFGTPFQGGFYIARFRLAESIYALISAPKSTELAGQRWINGSVDVLGARSFNDGHANTLAMAEAGSELAKSIRALSIDGFEDFYLASRDEQELLYRYGKPTTKSSYGYRSGENPSALPPTHAYTDAVVQTSAAAFQEGGDEAFEAEAYWTSTQYSPSTAWFQTFDDGYQFGYRKSAELRARAVRRFKVE